MNPNKQHYRVVVSKIYTDELMWIGEFSEENRSPIRYYFMAVCHDNIAIYYQTVVIYPNKLVYWEHKLETDGFPKNYLSFLNSLEKRNREIQNKYFPQIYTHRPQIKGIMPADHRLYRD